MRSWSGEEADQTYRSIHSRIRGAGERVNDQAGVIHSIKVAYGDRPGVELDELDGLTVSGRTSTDQIWWFNVRPSNTEPLLRLNVEGPDVETMSAIRDEALAIIRGGD